MLPKHFTRTEHRAGLPHLDKPLMRQNPIGPRPVWGTNKQINKQTRKQTPKTKQNDTKEKQTNKQTNKQTDK